VDGGQYWNTTAKNDGKSALDDTANYAGKPDTKKAAEARFPDGKYTIHVRARDLIQESDDLTTQVVIENFAPIVCGQAPKGELPATTTEAQGYALFSEAMDQTVPLAGLVTVDKGATVADLQWSGDRWLVFKLKQLQKGTRYNVTVSAAAKDVPGTPGGNALDGDQDGNGGDAFTYGFKVKN
jgi:hypothetical protein